MPLSIFGLLTTTSFTKNPPYDLQRVAPQHTNEIDKIIIIAFWGRTNEINNPSPKVINIKPFELPRLFPIKQPPAYVI